MAQAIASPIPVRCVGQVSPHPQRENAGKRENIPVFPDVGSITTLLPGISFPSRSAASTMAFAMRSLTDPPADMYSTFPTAQKDATRVLSAS